MSEIQQDSAAAGEAKAAATTLLADVLKERGALPELDLLRTFLQVLDDLRMAHDEGLLHRDINPARIVLNGEGWKLTDYGLAKVGTVRYMSPERCQGRPMDARSDIYSLGVVLFQAATGQVPFDAEMKFQIMEAHASTPPPAPRTINPAVSAELEQVILRALAKDPADRFQSAAEFKQALVAVAPETVQSLGPPAGPAAESAVEPEEEPDAESEQSTIAEEPGRGSRRVKPAAILVPLGIVVAVVAGLLVTGVFGGQRVPSVTGMMAGEAEQVLRGKGFHVETDSADDTLAAGTVAAQEPLAGQRVSRSRPVKLSVSTGMVAVPDLKGLTLSDARARLENSAITLARVDSLYSDSSAVGFVVSSGLKAGTRVAARSGVSLAVTAGRATCPECGVRRESGAKFCTRCGYKY